MVSARRSRGFVRPTTPAAAFSGACPSEATTSATDRARMRSTAKAAVERAGTLWRHADAAQERMNALKKQTRRWRDFVGLATQRRPTPPGKETRVMTDADRDEIAGCAGAGE